MASKPTENHEDSIELLPSFLFPATTSKRALELRNLKKQQRIRSIGPRLYTALPKSKVPAALRSNWSDIVSHLFPTALLSHRSALEYQPTSDGIIYLTGKTNRRVEYPGLTFEFLRGPPPLEDDPTFMNFHASSLARAMLENFSTSKKTMSRALTNEKIKERLEQELSIKGDARFQQLRDRAREIAKQLGWEREFKKFDRISGAIAGSRSIGILTTASGRARAIGRPFDLYCNEKLEALFAYLKTNPLPEIRETHTAADHSSNKAFFESYFSNYIEGTTFEIDEAEKIIFDRQIPRKRPKDAHDILGTYNLVSDPNEMQKQPVSSDELEKILRTRHRIMLEFRPEVSPGEYKDRPNRAGDSHFVLPEKISGTIEKGFQKYRELPVGLPRAIFLMFLVAEVHPFVDGNGRLARIMMNAELFSAGLATIIIPTVYREDYLMGLRALSRRVRAEPLVKMLTRAQQFSNLEYSPYAKTLKTVTKT